MKSKLLALAIATLAALASCSSPKIDLPYFSDIEKKIPEGSNFDAGDYKIKIQPGDELYIAVYSNNPASASMYNITGATPYVVDSEGNIQIPVLGSIHVAGKTIEEIRNIVTAEVSKDVTDPTVTVRLAYFRVNVAGEVQMPRAINVTRERYSILDAIADAGDLTPYGERNNVLLIREEDGQRVYHRLNLNSADLLKSPYFYLQQNDFIYVEPNDIRKSNAKYNQNNAFKLTVISTIVSAASVIASLAIALTVRRR